MSPEVLLNEVNVSDDPKPAAAAAATIGSVSSRLFRRKHYLLYRFQATYAVVFVVLPLFLAAMLGMVIYGLFLGQASPDLTMDPDYRRRLTWFLGGVVAFVFIAFSFLYVLVVLATHRVAGPMAVMTTYMREFANGKFPVMRALRETDELKEFFDLFSAAVSHFKNRNGDEARLLRETIATLERQSAGSDVLATLKAMLRSRENSN